MNTTRQMYKKNEEIPAGYSNIILPNEIATALKNLDLKKNDHHSTHLCTLLDPEVLEPIIDFIALPEMQKEALDNLLYGFLDLMIISRNDYYDQECHQLFYSINSILKACINHSRTQKTEGGSNE